MGALAAEAPAHGYRQEDAARNPYHGYYFRILTAQDATAPGGARSYVVNGAMRGGFALIAWPAGYGESGVMTFMVGPAGVVHQKDLGPDTKTLAPAIVAFDPDVPGSRRDGSPIVAAAQRQSRRLPEPNVRTALRSA